MGCLAMTFLCSFVDLFFVILDHFDWSYDTQFTCTTKPLQTYQEERTTTVQLCIYRDSTFFVLHKHMWRDELDGDTKISEECLRGIYRIRKRQLILTGNLDSSFIRYKQTFDADGSEHTVTNFSDTRKIYRDDLWQYDKMRSMR